MSAVAIRNLGKRFGAVTALREVSFDVPRGGVFGLIGPNGAGKTTLLSIILGNLAQTSGSVSVLGVPPGQVHRLHGQVGALPQGAELPGTVSVGKTLSFFGRLCGLDGPALSADIERVLRVVDLADCRDRKLHQLSHGMRKRVGIAQALLGKPELIMLDEPTAGLDPRHAHDLIQQLSQVAKSATVIISSHNLVELEALCDRAAILVDGELVLCGTMDDIRDTRRQVRISVSAEPDPLPDCATFDHATNTMILRFAEGTSTRDMDHAIADAVQALAAQGVSIRSVERGQSLLKAYLDLS